MPVTVDVPIPFDIVIAIHLFVLLELPFPIPELLLIALTILIALNTVVLIPFDIKMQDTSINVSANKPPAPLPYGIARTTFRGVVCAIPIPLDVVIAMVYDIDCALDSPIPEPLANMSVIFLC